MGAGRAVRRRATRSRRPRWAIALLGLLVLAGGAWWVTNSRLFDVRTLRIDGNVHLSSDDVAGLASLTSDTNVLWMSTEDVERRLERHPWVQVADVTRTLPGVVTISVRERTPVAVLRGRGRLLVSGDGMVLGGAADSVPLPLIAVPGRHRTGDRVAPSDGRVSVAGALPADLRDLVASVSVKAGPSIVLELRTGVRVLMGDAAGVRAKLQALRGVLSWAARNGIDAEYIDVRVAAVPVLMPRTS